MNKNQKEVERAKLLAERNVLNRLKRQYENAGREIARTVKRLQSEINGLTKMLDEATKLGQLEQVNIIKSKLQAKVYQQGYQNALKKQIDTALEKTNTSQARTIAEYMKECYTTGYVGTMYDLLGQGIPLVKAIDPTAVESALKLNSKVSKRLYGGYTNMVKKRIQSEISRGIATASSFSDIATSLNNQINFGFNNAMRIVRTEGHRIQQVSADDARHIAKEAGADIVKQWDSTLDGSTRESHAMVDGEIVGLDEAFSNGLLYAGDPAGGAEEVINCRCATLQRAKWALDEDELQTLKDRAEYYGLTKEKAKNFEDYQEKYLKMPKITEVDKKAVLDYMTSKSYVINDKLRNNQPLTFEEKKFTMELDRALDKMPKYNGNLQRSLQFRTANQANEFIKAYAVGETINYSEYISTTKGNVYNPDGQVQICIKDAKSGRDISKFNSDEAEVLYERGSTFIVKNIVETMGKIFILLREKA